MTLPFFYVPELKKGILQLEEDTSKHLIGVLRKSKGASILLTDGKGKKAEAEIIDDNRKKCKVQVEEILEVAPKSNVAIGISLIKNASRFEWFLEKATEIGIIEIIPLLCERTEKEHFRLARMEQILISAMLQSQQCWMPKISEPVNFSHSLKNSTYQNKFIAHCLPQQKNDLSKIAILNESIILIGPEGDFTSKEIETAVDAGFTPVSLGETRLRTETAGMVAAVILCITSSSKS